MRKSFQRARAVALSASLVAIIAAQTAVSASAEYMKPDEASQRAVSVYQSALKRAGRSNFIGYCAMAVNNELMVMGINSAYVDGNANVEWENYANLSTSSGGYDIRHFPATAYTLKSALQAIQESDNNANLLVCFQQGRTSLGKIYGHTFYVHAVIDDVVYYVESFHADIAGTHYPEGSLLAISIDELCSYYSNCVFEGIHQFVDHTYDEVAPDPILSEEYPFLDIYVDWMVPGIEYCYQNGIFSGISPTSFAPEAVMTRAMLVQTLYNMEGEPETDAELCYTDVDEDAWYADAIKWATEQDVVNGIGEETFAPEEEISREQYMTMLYRYVVSKQGEPEVLDAVVLEKFSDADAVSDWAKEGAEWCVAHGVITGTSETTIAPMDATTRGQGATIMMRLQKALQNG